MLMTRNHALLTTEQAAQRLGVQAATIYAYVSRGVLHRSIGEDGRTSRFDAAEVDRVARRGRPRTGATRRGGIDVSLVTSITHIEPERLSYRGHDAIQLAAEKVSFERVAELLWSGALPDEATWPLPEARAANRIRMAMPKLATPLERLAAASAAIASMFPLRNDLRPAAVVQHGRALIASLVECLPRIGATTNRPVGGHSRRETPSLAARLWPRLTEMPPRPAHLEVLDAALVLLADHELATSTMAVRVAASTRANPFAAVLAGLGAMAGPLHGAAPADGHRLLLAAASGTPEEAVARALATRSLQGFGHSMYRDADPRAVHLLERIREITTKREQAVIDDVLAAAMPVADAKPNSDFALAALAFVTKMPLGATEAIFALARTAGWIAHALEEYGEAPLRFRARAIYVS